MPAESNICLFSSHLANDARERSVMEAIRRRATRLSQGVAWSDSPARFAYFAADRWRRSLAQRGDRA
jgi:hypothetical protein